MAYAQVSDVTNRAPGVEISNTSKPSAGQVTTMIGEVERELEPQLTNLGYTTPIVQATSPKAFAILTDKVAHAVLARVLRARAFGSSDPRAQGADAAQKVFDDWLCALGDAKDPTELPDATRTSKEVPKDAAARTRSFVEGLSTDEFDIDAPAVTMRQTF